MKTMLSELGRAARCFFDWPQLHTRIMCYASLTCSFVLLFRIQAMDHDNALQRGMAEGLSWLIVFVVIGYSSKNAMENLLAILGARFGVQRSAPAPKEEKPDDPANSR